MLVQWYIASVSRTSYFTHTHALWVHRPREPPRLNSILTRCRGWCKFETFLFQNNGSFKIKIPDHPCAQSPNSLIFLVGHSDIKKRQYCNLLSQLGQKLNGFSSYIEGNVTHINLEWTQCGPRLLPTVFPRDCAAAIPLRVQNCSQACIRKSAIIKYSFIIELCWRSSFTLKRRSANEYLWIFFFLVPEH